MTQPQRTIDIKSIVFPFARPNCQMSSSFRLFYSPQPDESPESSAAYEYAKRASDTLCVKHHHVQKIERLSAKSTLDSLANQQESATHVIILVSCSADGSVDREVRKLIRILKNGLESKDDCRTGFAAVSLTGIALLGHARCENSANQMSDTIYNHGRKLDRSIDEMIGHRKRKRLETQVELEGPDSPGGFDEWLNEIASALSQ